MKILFDDYLQYAVDCPASLCSAPLADIWTGTRAEITLDTERTIDCIGIGYTDATNIEILVNDDVVFGTLSEPSGQDYSGFMSGPYVPTMSYPPPIPGLPEMGYESVLYESWTSHKDNGLYLLNSPVTLTKFVIRHNGTFIGRIAIGEYVFLGCSPSREPGLWSTSSSRTTVSGQVVPGAGGITGRQINVEVTYKIDSAAFSVIEQAHSGAYGQGFPVFVYFEKEGHRFPWERMYATNKISEMVFQSSVNRFLYSRQFFFKEAY